MKKQTKTQETVRPLQAKPQRGPDDEGAQFRLLAEMVPQLVWRSRDDGQWDWAGPQWHAFTGQSEGDSLGLGWEDMVHPGDKATTERAWNAASSRGELEVKHRLRRADGTYRWFHTRALPLQDQDHVTRHWFGTSTDVDDLRRAEERALFLAHHDSLTGAANRTGLQRALERTAADGEQGLCCRDQEAGVLRPCSLALYAKRA